MIKKYRNNGAIGAILDEYEKAVHELVVAVSGLSKQELTTIVDTKTTVTDCQSIQTVLTHVIRAGYNYVVEIRRSLGEDVAFVEHKSFNTADEYKLELNKMFAYNEMFFNDYPRISLEEYISEKKIKVEWGQRYDIEQLFEHAIVHILRYRRQIEVFKINIKSR